MTRPALTLAPPPDRGPLLDAAEVATLVCHGKVKPAWVKRHLGRKRYLGARAVWYLADAQVALEEYHQEQRRRIG